MQFRLHQLNTLVTNHTDLVLTPLIMILCVVEIFEIVKVRLNES